ncbi:MAG: hypothetical protein QOH65_925 [Methylobacteriaceae bacterium]|nr:hypothetical protein [Methylobacteriaceae bacterium]
MLGRRASSLEPADFVGFSGFRDSAGIAQPNAKLSRSGRMEADRDRTDGRHAGARRHQGKRTGTRAGRCCALGETGPGSREMLGFSRFHSRLPHHLCRRRTYLLDAAADERSAPKLGRHRRVEIAAGAGRDRRVRNLTAPISARRKPARAFRRKLSPPRGGLRCGRF